MAKASPKQLFAGSEPPKKKKKPAPKPAPPPAGISRGTPRTPKSPKPVAPPAGISRGTPRTGRTYTDRHVPRPDLVKPQSKLTPTKAQKKRQINKAILLGQLEPGRNASDFRKGLENKSFNLRRELFPNKLTSGKGDDKKLDIDPIGRKGLKNKLGFKAGGVLEVIQAAGMRGIEETRLARLRAENDAIADQAKSLPATDKVGLRYITAKNKAKINKLEVETERRDLRRSTRILEKTNEWIKDHPNKKIDQDVLKDMQMEQLKSIKQLANKTNRLSSTNADVDRRKKGLETQAAKAKAISEARSIDELANLGLNIEFLQERNGKTKWVSSKDKTPGNKYMAGVDPKTGEMRERFSSYETKSTQFRYKVPGTKQWQYKTIPEGEFSAGDAAMVASFFIPLGFAFKAAKGVQLIRNIGKGAEALKGTAAGARAAAAVKAAGKLPGVQAAKNLKLPGAATIAARAEAKHQNKIQDVLGVGSKIAPKPTGLASRAAANVRIAPAAAKAAVPAQVVRAFEIGKRIRSAGMQRVNRIRIAPRISAKAQMRAAEIGSIGTKAAKGDAFITRVGGVYKAHPIIGTGIGVGAQVTIKDPEEAIQALGAVGEQIFTQTASLGEAYFTGNVTDVDLLPNAEQAGNLVEGFLNIGESLFTDADVAWNTFNGLIQMGAGLAISPFYLIKKGAESEDVGDFVSALVSEEWNEIQERWKPVLEGDWEELDKRLHADGMGGAFWYIADAWPTAVLGSWAGKKVLTNATRLARMDKTYTWLSGQTLAGEKIGRTSMRVGGPDVKKLGVHDPDRFKDNNDVEFVSTAELAEIVQIDRTEELTDEFLDDVRENGFESPAILMYGEENGKLRLHEGNHRVAAAIKLGFESVPVRGWVYRGELGPETPAGKVFDAPANAPIRSMIGHIGQEQKPSQFGMSTLDPADYKSIGRIDRDVSNRLIKTIKQRIWDSYRYRRTQKGKGSAKHVPFIKDDELTPFFSKGLAFGVGAFGLRGELQRAAARHGTLENLEKQQTLTRLADKMRRIETGRLYKHSTHGTQRGLTREEAEFLKYSADYGLGRYPEGRDPNLPPVTPRSMAQVAIEFLGHHRQFIIEERKAADFLEEGHIKDLGSKDEVKQIDKFIETLQKSPETIINDRSIRNFEEAGRIADEAAQLDPALSMEAAQRGIRKAQVELLRRLDLLEGSETDIAAGVIAEQINALQTRIHNLRVTYEVERINYDMLRGELRKTARLREELRTRPYHMFSAVKGKHLKHAIREAEWEDQPYENSTTIVQQATPEELDYLIEIFEGKDRDGLTDPQIHDLYDAHIVNMYHALDFSASEQTNLKNLIEQRDHPRYWEPPLRIVTKDGNFRIEEAKIPQRHWESPEGHPDQDAYFKQLEEDTGYTRDELTGENPPTIYRVQGLKGTAGQVIREVEGRHETIAEKIERTKKEYGEKSGDVSNLRIVPGDLAGLKYFKSVDEAKAYTQSLFDRYNIWDTGFNRAYWSGTKDVAMGRERALDADVPIMGVRRGYHDVDGDIWYNETVLNAEPHEVIHLPVMNRVIHGLLEDGKVDENDIHGAFVYDDTGLLKRMYEESLPPELKAKIEKNKELLYTDLQEFGIKAIHYINAFEHRGDTSYVVLDVDAMTSLSKMGDKIIALRREAIQKGEYVIELRDSLDNVLGELEGAKKQMRDLTGSSKHHPNRYAWETSSLDLDRVDKIAANLGLASPFYFRSAPIPGSYLASMDGFDTAEQAMGVGEGDLPGNLPPSGKRNVLSNLGMQDLDPRIATQGVAANITRFYDYRRISRAILEYGVSSESVFHKIPYDKRKTMSKPESAREFQRVIEAAGLDPESFVIVSSNALLKRVREVALEEGDAFAQRSGEFESIYEVLEQETLSNAANRKKQATNMVAIPRHYFKEMSRELKASSKAAKYAWDIPKSWAARMLLGTNLSWAQFQVYANATLAGIAGVGPRAWFEANEKWKTLDPEVRAGFDTIVNVSHPYMDVQKMNSALSNGFTAFTNSTWYRRNLLNRNPLDPLFMFDRKNNMFFRRAVIWNQAKKEAYRRMNGNFSRMMTNMDRMNRRFGGDAKGYERDFNEILLNIARDPKALENLANATNDFMGDYMTFTKTERMFLNRYIMFYGFLRHSIQFTLWNLPVKHPVRFGLIAKLAELAINDEKDLLEETTGKSNPSLPTPLLGNFFFKGQVDVPILGKLGFPGLNEIDLRRASIAGNFIFELRHPAQILSVIPPPYARAFEAILGVSFYTGRPLRGGPKPSINLPVISEWTENPLDYPKYWIEGMLSLNRQYRKLTEAKSTLPFFLKPDTSSLLFDQLSGDWDKSYAYSDESEHDTLLRNRKATKEHLIRQGPVRNIPFFGDIASTPILEELTPFRPVRSGVLQYLDYYEEQRKLEKEAEKSQEQAKDQQSQGAEDFLKDTNKRLKKQKPTTNRIGNLDININIP